MKQLQPSETLPVGLLLALAGGLLDGYSYLNRGQVFATAETGNIVLMGINLAQGQLDQALHYLLPILAFALGVLAAELLRRRFGDSTRLHWRLPLLLAECGAILHEEKLEDLRWSLGLNESSRVLCISTEGDTDQANYQKIVGERV